MKLLQRFMGWLVEHRLIIPNVNKSSWTQWYPNGMKFTDRQGRVFIYQKGLKNVAI